MYQRHAVRWLSGTMSLVCVAVVAAPLLAASAQPAAAALIYMLLAPLCHQARERSFLLLGFPLAVCARCTGIYLGVWLEALSALMGKALLPSRRWTIVALGPLVADVATELAGLRPPLAWLRFLTGFLAGVAGGAWVVHSAHRLADELKQSSGLEQEAAPVRIFR